MYARIHFVNPGSREKYSWVIDTEHETVNHWQHEHPEAEDLSVTLLDDKKGLEALYWQKCLYHDVFFERSTCSEVRKQGWNELMDILDLAGRLDIGRASELWNHCMAFRFGNDPIARRPLIIHAPAVEQDGLSAVPQRLTFVQARSAANESRVASVRVVSAR
jgi:hypothetical protein